MIFKESFVEFIKKNTIFERNDLEMRMYVKVFKFIRISKITEIISNRCIISNDKNRIPEIAIEQLIQKGTPKKGYQKRNRSIMVSKLFKTQ